MEQDMPTSAPTPQSVYKSFQKLATQHQMKFARLAGGGVSAEFIGELWNASTVAEQILFIRPLLERVIATIRPILIREAVPIIRAYPGLSAEELIEPISDAYERSIRELESGLVTREKQRFKQERERKSSPTVVKRNVEICDLYKTGKWSHERLARKYGVQRPAIQKVLKQCAKWRRLSDPDPN